jgi:YggT family protein
MGEAIIYIIYALIDLITWVVIINAVLSWLIVFDVINIRNPQMAQIVRTLDNLTRPLLAPIRRFLPSLGGVDISPIILFILLKAVHILVQYGLERPLIGLLG